jgi:RNA polymerase nonessential primary-like sigma factor
MTKLDNQSEITSWLNNAGRFPLLPAERVSIIATQIQSLPEDSPRRRKLVNTLVQHNLRLVARFVKGFMSGSSHNKWGSPETVDYLQTGSLGLVRAAEMYDPKRGYTFATYANFWIRSLISRYNMKTLTPVYVSESASRQLIFYKRNGYVKSRTNGQEVPKEKIDNLKRLAAAAYSCVSLNVPSETGQELMDSIPDNSKASALDEFGDQIHQAMDEAGISAIGKEVLLGHFVREEKLKDIAERLGLSAHRAKTEKDRAVRLVKASPELFRSGIM